MARRKVKLLHKGFDELRTQPRMQAAVDAEAERIALRAGEGVYTQQSPSKHRARANAYTATMEAMLNEARYGSLSKAIG